MNWVKSKLTQGNSYEGVALVAAGIIMLMAPLNLVAYAMVAYGAIKIIKN
jgi:hypothetical protein